MFQLQSTMIIATTLLCAAILGPILIPFLKRLKFGQAIREDGPQSHLKKSGTPTMGGVIFLLAMVLVFFALPFYRGENWSLEMFILMCSLLSFGMIGFIDDFIIVVKKDNSGLRPRHKLFGQFIVAAVVFYLLTVTQHPTNLSIFGWFEIEFGWLYGVIVLLWLVGFSNATNLTDGLDGLCTGISIICFAVFAIISFWQGNDEVIWFCLMMIGALSGFLLFNLNPAKVFMGDTGSLAIGASLATVAMLLGQELLLVIVGGVFVVETISVILQVIYYKKTKKRLFKMAPLHHHFELSGWSEKKVVYTFWLVSIALGALALWMA